MTEVAVVGLGYWGPNLVRNLASLKDVNVLTLCDDGLVKTLPQG